MQIFTTKQFEKDIKKLKKQNKDFAKFKTVLGNLTDNKQLPRKYKNHKLKGNFKDRFEYHIQPDWLLIYKLNNETLILERTGSHSDLFC